MSSGNGQQQQAPPAVTGEVVGTRRLLEELLNTQRSAVLNVVTGNFPYREAVLLDSPSSKAKRILVPRYGVGGQVAVAQTITPVLSPNEGCLGRVVVNWGAAPVILYLANAGDLGGVGQTPSGQALNRPQVWLAGGGGSFDFRLANVLYAGEVNAAGQGGTSTLAVAEF